ncbi:MAG: hypothetical protein IKJ59_15855 [Clostridia bacterium]|nr:hypothetical protein [Clostridia bacterium]
MFCDNAHWQAFTDSVRRLKNSDVCHISLAYLLTVDTVTRDHIDDCFDFDNDSIKLDALKKSWQTSTSLKTTRLSFNLWNGCYSDGAFTSSAKMYTVEEIFNSPLAEYYWQAIKLRFNL